MMDYYSILEIPKSASKIDVKKAYFRMIRKYPPDRMPDEFKKTREAYEILFDEHTRKEYDSIDSMPSIVKTYYNSGKQAMAEGDYESAVLRLKEITKVYPDFTVVNSLLGDAALENGNSGTAVQIFKKLVDKEPENASFSGKLAQAYLERGWQRKAIEQFNIALSLDEDNVSLWCDLIEAHFQNDDIDHAIKVGWAGIEVSKRNDWDNLPICNILIQLCLNRGKTDSIGMVLQEIRLSASKYSDEKDNIAWLLASIAKTMQRYGQTELAASIIETAHELLPDEEEIKNFMTGVQEEHTIRQVLNKLSKDSFYPEHYAYMFEFELDKQMGILELDNSEFYEFSIEMNVIMDIEGERKYVRRLKKSYPELYRLKDKFFNRVLNRSQSNRLYQEYMKKYDKLEKLYPERFVDDYYDDEDEDDDFFGFYEDDDIEDYEVYTPQEPIRREGPKIGRNDPCPCGSGKKYKKCCGKDG